MGFDVPTSTLSAEQLAKLALFDRGVADSLDSALSTTLATNIQRVVNLQDTQWSAKGDGVTHDGAAVRAAYTYLASVGGGVLHFPAGTYILEQDGTHSWSINAAASNILITGVKGQTWFKHPSGMPAQAVSIFNFDGLSNITIRDCGFDGNWGNAVTAIAAASDGAALPQATINVDSTTNFPNSGTFKIILPGGAQTITYTGKTATTFTGCTGGTGTIYRGYVAGYQDDYTQGLNHLSQDINPSNHGIMLRGCTNVVIENCVFKNMYGDCIWIGGSNTDADKGTTHVVVRHCVGDIMARNAISVPQKCEDITVDSCRFTNVAIQCFDTEPQSDFRTCRDINIRHSYLGGWWNKAAAGSICAPLSIVGAVPSSYAESNAARQYRIHDCTIEGAIQIEACSDVVIDKCRIICDWTGNSWSPVLIDHQCDDIWILDNYIYDRTGSAGSIVHDAAISVQWFSGSSGVIQQPAGVHIIGNRIDARNGRQGIKVEGSGGGAAIIASTHTYVSPDSGTATAVTSTTLSDSGKTWTTNQFKNTFRVYMGSAVGTITANTTTQLTVLGWTTPLGIKCPAPALGTYRIMPVTGLVVVERNEIDCTDDGNGAGSYGIQVYAAEAGMRVRVRNNNIHNATTDGIHIRSSDAARQFKLIELVDNYGWDDQPTPTCTNLIGFQNTIQALKWVMRGNEMGVGITNQTSGLSTGTWLVHDGAVQQWAGFGAPSMSAPKGSTYQRLDGAAGTCFYVNESGSTTWVGK